MSWIQQLVKTYDNCTAAIGVQTAAEGENEKVPLLPIAHTTNKAQVEITLDQNGNFLRAEIVPKSEARTIIPCTESSGGRTSGEAPHPLCDKLQYVAKDYSYWGGSKKSYFNSYHEQLSTWTNSQYSDPKLKAILAYITKGEIISDLVQQGVFYANKTNQLLKKKDKKKDSPPMPIFDVVPEQEDAFIRWIVNIPGVLENRVWADNQLWEKWEKFYYTQKDVKDICHVTGTIEPIAIQHTAKIRNDGDKAKIISSNDTSGYTFRGKFETADQAASIGFNATQKAHAALRWLISRQGYRSGDLAIVSWATNGKEIPQLLDDQIDLLGLNSMDSLELSEVFTAQNIGIQIRKMIAGYMQELGEMSEVVVIGLDSATPGRLAITFYREMSGSVFLKKLLDWYETCQWKHRYRFFSVKNIDTEKTSNKIIPFVGTPTPKDIAEAAYGRRVDVKLLNATISRILPCIVDSHPIPRDLVESTIRQASSPQGKENWEWEKSLSIACALFRKFKPKENYKMSLEEDRTTRDYLYGRLLAIAENLENWALSSAKEKRETNASRLFQRFSERPFTTWRTLEIALSPYKARLGGKANKLLRLMDQIINAFSPEDFTSDKPLSGEFLLGYHCQREALWSRAEQNEGASEEAIEDN